MITVKNALDALKEAGLIEDWKWHTEYCYDMDGQVSPEYTEKWPVVAGADFQINNETYGRKSFLYFVCKNDDVKDQVAACLRDHGGKPNFKWYPDEDRCFEMQVRRFKGARHWE